MPIVKPHTRRMKLADKVTATRLVLAPFFLLVYFLPKWFTLPAVWTVPVLWVLLVIAEITDLLDGHIARARNEVSDFGKLFDPFSDTLVRITYFLCFVADGILPVVLFAVVLYREFGILFLRTLMMRMGIAMGARSGGKVKAVAYMLTGVGALVASSLVRLGASVEAFSVARMVAIGLFAVSVFFSLSSFVDYYRVFKSARSDS